MTYSGGGGGGKWEEGICMWDGSTKRDYDLPHWP